MGFPNVFVLRQVELAGSAVHQITNYDWQAGEEILRVGGDGKIDPEFAAIVNKSPVASITTSALSTALSLIGIGGVKLDGTAGKGVLYYQKMDPGGGRAGSGHASIDLLAGIAIPRRLRAAVGQGQAATLDFDVIVAQETKGSAPIALNTGVTLPAAVAATEQYTAGDVTVDVGATSPITLTTVQEIDVDFGISEAVVQAGGTIWPRHAGIQTREPTVTVRWNDPTQLASDFPTGRKISANPTDVVLPKLAEGGAYAGSGDVKVTINEGVAVITSFGGGADEPQVGELTLWPSHDGTNDILALTT